MNCIIFMKDYSIYEISEIVGFDEERGELKYKLVYKKPATDIASAQPQIDCPSPKTQD